MTSPESAGSSSTPSAPILTCRLATFDDEDELVKMRVACGWGETQVSARLRRSQMGLEFPCIFFLDDVPAGMGSIELIDSGEQDLDLADPSSHKAMISSLFIYPNFQGQNLGNRIMDLLELQCSYLGIKTITVHTIAYEPDGVTPSRTNTWYRRRGYTDIKEPCLRYGTVMSVYLQKAAPPIPKGGEGDEMRRDGWGGRRLNDEGTEFKKALEASLVGLLRNRLDPEPENTDD